mgnify:CR=1 FL=1
MCDALCRRGVDMSLTLQQPHKHWELSPGCSVYSCLPAIAPLLPPPPPPPPAPPGGLRAPGAGPRRCAAAVASRGAAGAAARDALPLRGVAGAAGGQRASGG